MTEAKWLACEDPEQMLQNLQSRLPERKAHLLNAASSRQIWSFLTPTCQRAVEVAERHADGLTTDDEYRTCWSAVDTESRMVAQPTPTALDYAVCSVLLSIPPTIPSLASTLSTAASAAGCSAAENAADGIYDRTVDAERMRIGSIQADLLRCIFGNPFRPVAFADTWRSETAVALSSAIYAERAFDRLSILADALEEAGCDHPDILSHCRGAGPHARGCWVVDLILGKE